MGGRQSKRSVDISGSSSSGVSKKNVDAGNTTSVEGKVEKLHETPSKIKEEEENNGSGDNENVQDVKVSVVNGSTPSSDLQSDLQKDNLDTTLAGSDSSKEEVILDKEVQLSDTVTTTTPTPAPEEGKEGTDNENSTSIADDASKELGKKKKEKKKKWSFRSFSFSKKDRIKPVSSPSSPNAGADDDAIVAAVLQEETIDENGEHMLVNKKTDNVDVQLAATAADNSSSIPISVTPNPPEVENKDVKKEQTCCLLPVVTTTTDEVPPPLPSSPPPTEAPPPTPVAVAAIESKIPSLSTVDVETSLSTEKFEENGVSDSDVVINGGGEGLADPPIEVKELEEESSSAVPISAAAAVINGEESVSNGLVVENGDTHSSPPHNNQEIADEVIVCKVEKLKLVSEDNSEAYVTDEVESEALTSEINGIADTKVVESCS